MSRSKGINTSGYLVGGIGLPNSLAALTGALFDVEGDERVGLSVADLVGRFQQLGADVSDRSSLIG